MLFRSEKLGIDLLAEVPLHMSIRQAADGGAPIVASAPDSPQAEVFRTIAATLVEKGVA